jgi:hypothetical protein
MDLINVVSAVATVAALALAAWQYVEGRKAARRERAHLSAQDEWLRSATDLLIVAAETADQIVQRGKRADVTVPELQGLARVVRRQLAGQVRQLQEETAVLRNWRIGRSVDSSADATPDPSTDPPPPGDDD